MCQFSDVAHRHRADTSHHTRTGQVSVTIGPLDGTFCVPALVALVNRVAAGKDGIFLGRVCAKYVMMKSILTLEMEQ